MMMKKEHIRQYLWKILKVAENRDKNIDYSEMEEILK